MQVCAATGFIPDVIVIIIAARMMVTKL